MKKHNPVTLEINSLKKAKEEIKKIESDPLSIDIMAPKAVLKVIKFKDVLLQDAIIVKQDMLSIGGEVAVPKNTFELKQEKADILIIGTLKQLRELTMKLNRHYSRIKRISEELSELLEDLN